VNLFIGKSKSVTENDLTFRQQGIMPRLVVLQAIERKFNSQGLVVLQAIERKFNSQGKLVLQAEY